jgi:hypothetical protein
LTLRAAFHPLVLSPTTLVDEQAARAAGRLASTSV